MKRYFNIVLIGAAGSGKGTQSELIKNELNLLQISTGNVLREYCKDLNAKYTKTLLEFMNKGQLVPCNITHELMTEVMNSKIFCKDCEYNGIIFDGFPRQIDQLNFLDKFLEEKNSQIDAVIYIDISVDALIDRLSNRFACMKCGEIYNKVSKPTKVKGTCDKCGNKEFKVRDDDKNVDAIKNRFKIFEESTKPVLKMYKKRNIVICVDGTQSPQRVSEEIFLKLSVKS